MVKRTPDLDPVYQEKLALYQRLVQTIPEVACKGDKNPYTSVNGHMFSYLHPSGALALRLAETDRQAFLKDNQATLFRAYGVVQKEYVAVPDDLLRDAKRLRKYFRASFDYVSGLKPKAKAKK
jgi:hypothetical protein